MSEHVLPQGRDMRDHEAVTKWHSDWNPIIVVEERHVIDLLPQIRRPRAYSLNDIIAAADRIAKFGFQQPVILDRKGLRILDGELRIDAARWLDMDTVPCFFPGGFSGSDERCLRQAVSQLAKEGDWDLTALLLRIEALIRAEEQIGLEGFTPLDLDQILREQEGTSAADGDDPEPGSPGTT